MKVATNMWMWRNLGPLVAKHMASGVIVAHFVDLLGILEQQLY